MSSPAAQPETNGTDLLTALVPTEERPAVSKDERQERLLLRQRKVREPSDLVAEELEQLAGRLRGKVSRGEELAQLRDRIIELTVIYLDKGKQLERISAALSWFLRGHATHAGRALADELERRALIIENQQLHKKSRFCLDLLERILSEDELAQITGVKVQTVRRWHKAGPGPQVYSDILYPLAQAAYWLRRAGKGYAQIRGWLLEQAKPNPAHDRFQRSLHFYGLGQRAFTDYRRQRGLEGDPIADLLTRHSAKALAPRLEEASRVLLAGAPSGEQLERLASEILDLIGSAKVAHLRRREAMAALGDLLRDGGDETAERLGALLLEATGATVGATLNFDRTDHCLTAIREKLGLTLEEIAQLLHLDVEELKEWGKDSTDGARPQAFTLSKLAGAGFWLERAGFERAEARAWFFESEHEELEGNTPAEAMRLSRLNDWTIYTLARQKALDAIRDEARS